jgi:hypothetical protein
MEARSPVAARRMAVSIMSAAILPNRLMLPSCATSLTRPVEDSCCRDG